MYQFDFADAMLLLLGRDMEMLGLLSDALAVAGFRSVPCRLEELQHAFGQGEPSLILYDESAPLLDAEQLYALIQERSPWKRVPFMLLSDTYTGARAARCLDRGMSEFVAKPFDVDELAARVRKILREGRGEHILGEEESLASEAVQGFSGDLAYLGLPDLLMTLHQNMRTGELEVQMEVGEFTFYFERGKLVGLVGPYGMRGLKALFRAIRDFYGRFVFTPTEQTTCAHPRDHGDLPNLILQAVQESDEYNLLREKLPPAGLRLTYRQGGVAAFTEIDVLRPMQQHPSRLSTIEELVLHSPKTDLQTVRELLDLFEAEQLIVAGG